MFSFLAWFCSFSWTGKLLFSCLGFEVTNAIASKRSEEWKTQLPVDVGSSKMSVLKFPFKQWERGWQRGRQNPQKDWGENAVVAVICKQLRSHYKMPLIMSLKEVRNQLLISHDEGVINDEEFLLLYDLNTSNNLDLAYDSYPGFDFDDLEDDECLSEIRFYKNDLPFLAEVLGIPEVVKCYQRSICSGLEALCILLKRHSYPCRYSDMIARFGKPM